MPLLDLSAVTKTFVKLLDESIKASPAWSGTFPLVSPAPPDRLDGADNVLGFYLYHVIEEPSLKNEVWAPRPGSPVRLSPMALNLHYILSAHSKLDGDLATYREQLMLGIALKALHDNPKIDDNTRINGITIMDPGLVGDENRMRVDMRQVPVNEAISYWTAVGERPLRLSAYYEASVILLEPDDPSTSASRTLVPQIQAFVGGMPHLDASRNQLTVTVPGETTARTFLVQPAQVAPGDELQLLGSDLTGDAVALSIEQSGWAAPLDVDAAWGVSATADRVFATVQRTIGATVLLPGAYTASVRVSRSFPAPSGGTKQVDQSSNATPFMLVPAVTSFSAVDPLTGVFTLTGATFQDPRLVAGAVRGYIAGVALATGTSGSLNPGEMAITSAATIEMRLPAGLAAGRAVPVRVLVNGAESPPRWVTAP